MNESELLENLLDAVQKISFDNQDELDIVTKRTEMLVRKIFGDDSHYLDDLKAIRFIPSIIFGGLQTDWKSPFDGGLKQFKNLIQIMIEDKKVSSNYENENISNFIVSENSNQPDKKTLKEVRILIASPSDVKRERELLLEKLETKFRREHYEEISGTRIIVDGWEYVPPQSGYGQDIINSDLVSKANIVVAVFRHKLGNPTIDIGSGKERSPSGTAEELLYAIRNKTIKNPPLGMAYFYSIAPVISIDSIDLTTVTQDWEKLKAFKEEIKNEILYKTYKSEEEILDIVSKDLCDNIIKYFTID